MLSPNDLTLEMRNVLLDQVRRQVGEANFQRLINTVGEDVVLAEVLRQLSSAAGQESALPVPVRRKPLAINPLWLLLFGFLLWCGAQYHQTHCLKDGSDAFFRFRDFDWQPSLKITIGFVGIVLDVCALSWLSNREPTDAPKGTGERPGCLDTLAFWLNPAIWYVLLGVIAFGGIGLLAGPVLFVWGVIGLFR